MVLNEKSNNDITVTFVLFGAFFFQIITYIKIIKSIKNNIRL